MCSIHLVTDIRQRHSLQRSIRPLGIRSLVNIRHRHSLLRSIRPSGIRSLASLSASAKEKMRQRNHKRQPQRRPETIDLESVNKLSGN